MNFRYEIPDDRSVHIRVTEQEEQRPVQQENQIHHYHLLIVLLSVIIALLFSIVIVLTVKFTAQQSNGCVSNLNTTVCIPATTLRPEESSTRMSTTRQPTTNESTTEISNDLTESRSKKLCCPQN